MNELTTMMLGLLVVSVIVTAAVWTIGGVASAVAAAWKRGRR